MKVYIYSSRLNMVLAAKIEISVALAHFLDFVAIFLLVTVDVDLSETTQFRRISLIYFFLTKLVKASLVTPLAKVHLALFILQIWVL